MTAHHADDPGLDHDGGLAADLPRLLSRRRLFGLGGAGLAAAVLTACGDDTASSAADSVAEPTATPAGTTSGGGPGGGAPLGGASSGVTVAEGEIPEETAGPYPGDGSNGPDVLTASGVIRRDIRSSFGSASGTAEGVPLTIHLTIVELEDGMSSPKEGAAVYLWHATREGGYSMYSQGITGQNYLRGVQVADAKGVVEFTSIFPACYDGRWPHVHFEIFSDGDTATKAGDRIRTTQLAFPADVLKAVYTAEGYEQSVTNLAKVSLNTDMVFSDGVSLQLAKVTGSIADGYTATLTVPV